MIKFLCPNCSVKLTAPEDRAGKLSKCPRCKSRITIPQQFLTKPSDAQEKVEISTTNSTKPLDEMMFDLPGKQNRSDDESELRQRERQQLESLGFKTVPQYTGERKFPWPIDVLLYPCSEPGLTSLAIIIGIPFVLSLIQRFVGLLSAVLALPLFLVNILIGLYAGWYFAECVWDSAKGGTRAPEVFGASVDLSYMWSRVLYLSAVYIIFILPFILYRMYTSRMDVIFWVLASWAVVFFPMGLLTMVMFDSSDALNPLFLLISIFRVFFQYVGLLILLGMLSSLIWLVQVVFRGQAQTIWLEVVGVMTSGYGAFVMAHVLGRFYWRYKEKLNWGDIKTPT